MAKTYSFIGHAGYNEQGDIVLVATLVDDEVTVAGKPGNSYGEWADLVTAKLEAAEEMPYNQEPPRANRSLFQAAAERSVLPSGEVHEDDPEHLAEAQAIIAEWRNTPGPTSHA
jgi:hypothetical protein